MLRVFRIRAWCLVTALCLTVGTASASLEVLLHGDRAHDDACAPVMAGPHDASAHHFQDSSSDDRDPNGTHCLACHWARSFRIFTASTPAAPNLQQDGAPCVAVHAAPLVAPVLAHLAPRSPPASA
jgi:hypothetical protein